MKWIADLEIYNISRELSKDAWNIYEELTMSNKLMIGNQFIRSMDSIWANIAEGFGRFHYLDSIKFYYNARWSLQESKHRIEILHDRKLLLDNNHLLLARKLNTLSVKLNNFITKAKLLLTKN